MDELLHLLSKLRTLDRQSGANKARRLASARQELRESSDASSLLSKRC
jgi:hypothetical protein